MLIIKNLKENVIELHGLKAYAKEFEVLSLSNKGKRLPFFVELVSTKNINLSLIGVNTIKITIHVSEIIKDEYIVLSNINGEKLKLTIKPNSYFTMERKYKFKITRAAFTEDGDLKLKILSQVNDKEIGWKCIYDGKPISYSIQPMENNESCYVTIKLHSEMLEEYVSKFIFEQDESGERIEYRINNTTDGMKKVD